MSTKYEQLAVKIASKLTNLPDLVAGQARHDRRIPGASGWEHQIDVSLESDDNLLLVECKCWERRVRGLDVLTLWGRVMDIQNSAANQERTVRGALVSTKGFQSGARKLVDHYDRTLSLFRLDESGAELDVELHRHFITVPTIPATGSLSGSSAQQPGARENSEEQGK